MARLARVRSLAVAPLLMLGLLAAPQPAAARSAGDPPPEFGGAVAVNDHGLVVGNRAYAQDRHGRFHLLDLPAPGRASVNIADANAVTDGGRIVGTYVSFGDPPVSGPVVWRSATARAQLLPLPPGSRLLAVGLSADDRDQVLVNGDDARSWLWEGGRYVSVQTHTSGALQEGAALDAAGDLLGLRTQFGRDWSVWSPTRQVDLAQLPDCFPVAHALADDRTVAGTCLRDSVPGPGYLPVTWSADGSAHLLALPKGYVGGEALSAARHGYVAGYLVSNVQTQGEFISFDTTAVVWHHGRPTVLGKPGSKAQGVNSKGEAVGYVAAGPTVTWSVWGRHSS